MNSHPPETISAPVDGYSRASEVSPGARWPCISGTIAERPDGAIAGRFRRTMRRQLRQHRGILVKVTTYLTDRTQAAPNREIRTRRLQGNRPAFTVVVARTPEAE